MIYSYLPAKLYEMAVRARLVLYHTGILKTYQLKSPVLSVGNLTVGGTGKTPCVAFLAGFLRQEGHHVAILSRGYRRRSKGLIEVSNGEKILCGPPAAGDEPYLLARECPGVRVVVDSDRYAAGRWLAERSPVTVFILDDGFQHLRLARDLNLALIDATEPLERLLPAGRLREPVSGLRRADAVIVTRCDGQVDRSALERRILAFARIPIFYAYHEMTKMRRLADGEKIKATSLAERRVAAFSGIARPERFIADLTELGIEIVERFEFPDHHHYQEDEFKRIIKSAREAAVDAVVTTEKDAANLKQLEPFQSDIPIYAAQIEFRCENMEELKRFILSKISLPSIRDKVIL
ncbi:MAG: tetraacyldisaccharide 4'-kinase [Blastocatellia bacterium]|nr:tetraacyldisaccharide 4'-kinase [Blastocatellia bacterium]